MPLLLVGQLYPHDSKVSIVLPSKLINSYKPLFDAARREVNLRIRAYLVKVFNDDGQVVQEFHRLEELSIFHSYTFHLDVDSIHRYDGIPIKYYLEVVLVSFIHNNKDKIVETPIFPNELRYEISGHIPSRVVNNVKTDIESLKKIGKDAETVSLLHTIGLHQVAEDLLEALKRFYSLSDFEGSIKFFRKVIEALRNYVRSENIRIASDKRTKFIQEFLSKAYQLISNFGEHAGTYGFMPEAELSKDIAVASARYIAQYLKK